MRTGHQYNLKDVKWPIFFPFTASITNRAKRMKDFLVLFLISKRALHTTYSNLCTTKARNKSGAGEKPTRVILWKLHFPRFIFVSQNGRLVYVTYITCIAPVVLFRTPCIRTLVCETACGINFVFLKVLEPEIPETPIIESSIKSYCAIRDWIIWSMLRKYFIVCDSNFKLVFFTPPPPKSN